MAAVGVEQGEEGAGRNGTACRRCQLHARHALYKSTAVVGNVEYVRSTAMSGPHAGAPSLCCDGWLGRGWKPEGNAGKKVGACKWRAPPPPLPPASRVLHWRRPG